MPSFRQCEIVIFDKIKLFTKEEIKEILDNKQSIVDYRFIYHDRDTYNQEDINYQKSQIDCGNDKIILHNVGDKKDNHYHIFIKLSCPTPCENIAKWFNISTTNINKLKIRDFEVACGYLVHYRQIGKYQYSIEDVISKNNDFKIIDVPENGHNATLDLFYKYGRCELSKKELLNLISIEDFVKYNNIYKKCFEYRSMKGKERDMQVLFICGESGSGKTTLAKFLAYNEHYDYFVSGSGVDVLDGYDKEECIILDDLRADSFTKSELFKLLDNNTNSSVKSRFHNKDISFCKLLIVTSIKTPFNLYDWSTNDFTNASETFVQFARRLDFCFLSVDKNGTILNLDIKPCKQSYCGYTSSSGDNVPFNMNNVFSALGINNAIKHKTTSLLNRVAYTAFGDKDLPF